MPMCAAALLGGCTSSPIILPEKAIVLPDRPPKEAQPEEAVSNQQSSEASYEPLIVRVADPTKFKLTYSVFSHPRQNPDMNGKPSPLQIRVYQLDHDGVFKAADYLTFLKQDQKMLGGSMLAWDTFMLGQGERKIDEKREMSRKARYFAVLGAFQEHRQLYTTDIVPINPKQHQFLCIYVKTDGIQIASRTEAEICPDKAEN